MSKIKQAGVLEVSVGGVGFRLRRRSTMVMAECRGLMAVAGQIAGADSKVEVSEASVADATRSVLKVALLEVNEGEGWRPAGDYDFGDLVPFADALMVEFMASALSVDPTSPSCEA